MLSEIEEYIEELAQSWSEVYKKSITTYLLLSILEKSEMWSKQIHEELSALSFGKLALDGKSLHRTLRRLEKQSLVTYRLESGDKTGAKRKIYSITPEGSHLLRTIKNKYLIA